MKSTPSNFIYKIKLGQFGSNILIFLDLIFFLYIESDVVIYWKRNTTFVFSLLSCLGWKKFKSNNILENDTLAWSVMFISQHICIDKKNGTCMIQLVAN